MTSQAEFDTVSHEARGQPERKYGEAPEGAPRALFGFSALLAVNIMAAIKRAAFRTSDEEPVGDAMSVPDLTEGGQAVRNVASGSLRPLPNERGANTDHMPEDAASFGRGARLGVGVQSVPDPPPIEGSHVGHDPVHSASPPAAPANDNAGTRLPLQQSPPSVHANGSQGESGSPQAAATAPGHEAGAGADDPAGSGPDDADEDGSPGPFRNRAPTLSRPVNLGELGMNTALIIGLSDLLAHASDADGDALSIDGLQSSSGSLRDRGDGTWLFTPEADDVSDVTFSYAVSDGQASVAQTAALDLIEMPSQWIFGTVDSDVLIGTPGGDQISARGGGDVVRALAGDDVVDAGSGDDVVIAGDGNDVVDAGDGDDIVFAGAGDDTVFGGSGNDIIFGEDGNDVLHGGIGDDQIHGGTGDDTIAGDGGDDHLSGGNGADMLDGGDGNDTIEPGLGDDIATGGRDDDVFQATATAGSSSTHASSSVAPGMPEVAGSSVQPSATASALPANAAPTPVEDDPVPGPVAEDSTVTAPASSPSSGVTEPAGEVSADIAAGQVLPSDADGLQDAETPVADAVDQLSLQPEASGNAADAGGSAAGSGESTSMADHQVVASNLDAIAGTAGDGCDIYDGGEGIDTIDISATSADAIIDLSSGMAASEQIGSDQLISIENAIGGGGDDAIIASASQNHLTGGGGDDTFVFLDAQDTAASSEEWDHVEDFEVGDQIDVSHIDGDEDEDGHQLFTWKGDDDRFEAAGELRYRHERDEDGEHTLVLGNTDDDEDEDFVIDLDGWIELTQDDFVGVI